MKVGQPDKYRFTREVLRSGRYVRLGWKSLPRESNLWLTFEANRSARLALVGPTKGKIPADAFDRISFEVMRDIPRHDPCLLEGTLPRWVPMSAERAFDFLRWRYVVWSWKVSDHPEIQRKRAWIKGLLGWKDRGETPEQAHKSIAEEVRAAVVALERRYSGGSWPQSKIETTVEEVLADDAQRDAGHNWFYLADGVPKVNVTMLAGRVRDRLKSAARREERERTVAAPDVDARTNSSPGALESASIAALLGTGIADVDSLLSEFELGTGADRAAKDRLLGGALRLGMGRKGERGGHDLSRAKLAKRYSTSPKAIITAEKRLLFELRSL